MKKLLLIISILALVLVPIGCNVQDLAKNAIEEMLTNATSTYTIKVSSNVTGLNFTGKYTWVNAAYDAEAWVVFSSDSEDVTGNVPEQYTVPDVISVGGMFQKQAVNGTLKVELWRGAVGTGTLIDSASTTDAYGAVLVTAIGKD